MTGPVPEPRFPGFSSMSQAKHWDTVTRDLIESRAEGAPGAHFFTASERRAARALCDQLTAQHEEPRIPVELMVEARIEARDTDGWRHAELPHDDEAWRQSLHHLDDDARDRHGHVFADCELTQQEEILTAVQKAEGAWHGLPAGQIWNLWMRYVCTAFYSHPRAWDEIGFPGPAFPRGYKNPGLDRREPFEVADARPDHADGSSS